MFTSLFARFRQRREMIRSLDGLLMRADDHLLEDIGLSRHDVRVMRQEAPGLLALPSAAPGGLRVVEA